MAQTPEGESDGVHKRYPGDAVSEGAKVSDLLFLPAATGTAQDLLQENSPREKQFVPRGSGRNVPPVYFSG